MNNRTTIHTEYNMYITAMVNNITLYDNRETPLAGNFVGRCQGHKSDVSTQSWVLISEKDNVTISGGCLYTHEWRELVTGGEVRNGMEKIMAIII